MDISSVGSSTIHGTTSPAAATIRSVGHVSVWGRTFAAFAAGLTLTSLAWFVPAKRSESAASGAVGRTVNSLNMELSEQANNHVDLLEEVAAQVNEIGLDPAQELPATSIKRKDRNNIFRSISLIGPMGGDVTGEWVVHEYSVNEKSPLVFEPNMVAIGDKVSSDVKVLKLEDLPNETSAPTLIRFDEKRIVGSTIRPTETDSKNPISSTRWAVAVPVPAVGWLVSPIEPAGVSRLFATVKDQAQLDISLHEGPQLGSPEVGHVRPKKAIEPERVRWDSESFRVLDTAFTTIIGHDKLFGVSQIPSTLIFSVGMTLSTLLAGFVLVGLQRRNRAVLEAALTGAQRSARTDSLTLLGNRLAITESLSLGANVQTPVAVLLCDLDRFKIINDARGHEAGDDVLREVARRLTSINSAAEVSRFGGDEFVFILRGAVSEQADEIAKEIISTLTRPYTVGTDSIVLGVSVGIAHATPEVLADGSLMSLVNDADAAMYVAKRSGGNAAVTAGEELRHHGAEQLEIEIALRAALGTGELEAWFQPLVNANGDVTALEALVRWQHPTKGLMSPGLFLPAAKSAGLLAEVSTVVLAQSCFQVSEWNRQRSLAGQAPLIVHVNCVEEQLFDTGFADVVDAYLKASALDPRCLLLEISEETAFERLPATLPTLDRIRSLGVHFSLDDFGFGNSSLTMVRRLGNIAELKIDKSIVDSLVSERDPGEAVADIAVIRAITDFATTQGITVVAEGIEFVEQFEALKALGVDLFQGFYFHRPQPPAKLHELLTSVDARV